MELLDVYDSYGNVTGRIIERGDKTIQLNDNEHIAVGVIYIENSNGEFLMQKTSNEKGGEYSSTGGHVGIKSSVFYVMINRLDLCFI